MSNTVFVHWENDPLDARISAWVKPQKCDDLIVINTEDTSIFLTAGQSQQLRALLETAEIKQAAMIADRDAERERDEAKANETAAEAGEARCPARE